MPLRFSAIAAPAIATLLATATLIVPSAARAYCRTITTPLPADYNPLDGCYVPPTTAIPLWWSNACVGYSVQQDASKQVTWAEADATAQRAFGKWSAPTCSGATAGATTPSIETVDEGAVACSVVEYSEAGPNQHAIIFRDTEWPHDDPYNTLALTTVTFDTDTGEILDADMELNTFQHAVVTTSPVPSGAYDLESILTHEAGHFLGLAHTPTRTAVMYASYQPGSTSLTSDDIDGICAIYLPDGDRSTDQTQSGSVTAVAVKEAACDATPKGGFGTACGPIGPVTRTTSGCTIAAGAGAGAMGPGEDGRMTLLFVGIAMAAAIRRQRGARLFAMKTGRAFLACGLVALGGATFAALAGIATERVAHASVVITVLFDELVRDSTGAALVTPTDQRAVWENGRIYTYTKVHVDRAVAGTLDSDPWVRTMGGIVGKVGQSVEGEAVLTVGRPGLLFLQPVTEEGPGVYVVTARAQGQFPVVVDTEKTERFVRASGVGAQVPTPRERVVQISRSRAMSGMASGAPLATDVLHKRPIEDGVRDVAAAWPAFMVRARLRLLLAPVAAGMALLTAASPARAYCRTTTVSVPADFDPIDGCWTQGNVLWWRNACVGYSIQQDASKQVTLTQAEQSIATAFAQWTATPCATDDAGASRVSIDVRDEGPVSCGMVQYNQDQPNQHVIVFHDDVWPYHDSSNTLALTTVTYDPDTGEIYDADMEVNTTVSLVVVGDPVAEGAYDFLSIVTHETGHFLGLAHSGDERATMYAHYQTGQTSMRNLTEDDVSGICAIYPSDGTRITSVGTPVVEGACDPTPRHGFSTQCASTESKTCLKTTVGAGGGDDVRDSRVAFGVMGVIGCALFARRRRRDRKNSPVALPTKQSRLS